MYMHVCICITYECMYECMYECLYICMYVYNMCVPSLYGCTGWAAVTSDLQNIHTGTPHHALCL